MWLLSPRRTIESFLHAASLPAEAFGTSRAVALPGMTVTVREMIDTLRARPQATAWRTESTFAPDPFIEKIVYGWATRFRPERALAMGFAPDTDFRSVVEAFIEDDLVGRFVA